MGKRGTGLGRRKSSIGSHSRKDEFSGQPAAGEHRNIGKQQRSKGKRFGKDEEQRFEQQVAELGARIAIMASDGNCLFRALADQLRGRPQDHGEMRQHIGDFMEEHEEDFAPFVEDDEKWSDYVPRMRCEGQWGGQQEICAASRCFRINVVIHQLDNPRFEFSYKTTAQTVHLSFHGDAHYNSVRAMDDPCREGEPAKAFMNLTAKPFAACSSSTSPNTSPSTRSSSSSHRRIKASEIQRPQEFELQYGEENDNMTGIEGSGGDSDGQGNEEDGEGEGEVDERWEAGMITKVGGQCPCGSGKKWRKCCRKAERQRERYMNGGWVGSRTGQKQWQSRPLQQRHTEGNDGNDTESTRMLTQKLAAIAL